MSALREIAHRAWGTISRRRHDRDLAEELRAHLELAAADARRRGHDPLDASRLARIQSGSQAQAIDALRDQRGLPLVEELARDFRYGLRSLRRSPAFTAVSLLTLALGIGANAAVFQLLEAIRFRELPVKSPERLVTLALADTARWQGRRTTGYPALTNALWEEIRDRQHLFAEVLAWSNADFRLDRETTGRSVRGLFVSGTFFDALGVTPVLGRLFSTNDDRPGCGLPGAVVSYGFWQRELGGDAAIVGRTISLNGRRVEVTGVTPAVFFGVEVGRSYDVAVPICSQDTLGSEEGWLRDGTIWWLTVMARMTAGESLARVNARLAALSAGVFRATVPGSYAAEEASAYLSLRLRAESASSGVSVLRARFGDPLLILLAITCLVLLLVCTNLASLVLARASTRQREFALRQSLGASRKRIIRQVMAENVLLGAAGAILGFALAGTFSRLLVDSLGPGVSVPLETDIPLIGAVALLAAVACLAFGLAPAWRASTGAANPMTTGIRGASAAAAGLGFRRALAVMQVAISLSLLFGALLFVATLRNLLAIDSGFHGDDVAVARVTFARADIAASRKAAFKRDLLDRFIATPGVTAAAEVRHVPLAGTGSSLAVRRDGAGPADSTSVRLNAISNGYLQTMGIRLETGRDFTSHDSAASPRVAIVNRSFVRRLGIAANPVGVRFRVEGSSSPVEVVGLVPDTKYFSLREDPLPIVFVPITQIEDPRSVADFVIRSTLPVRGLATVLSERVSEIAPFVDLDVRPFDAAVGQGLIRERLLAGISGFFGIVAVLIAAVGLYGVMAAVVASRRSEIGVRMALGAQRGDILAMVLRQAGTLLAAGICAGIALALMAAGFARPFVFGLDPHDTGVMLLACVCLAVPAVAAILVPAIRAVMLEPVAALRDE